MQAEIPSLPTYQPSLLNAEPNEQILRLMQSLGIDAVKTQEVRSPQPTNYLPSTSTTVKVMDFCQKNSERSEEDMFCVFKHQDTAVEFTLSS